MEMELVLYVEIVIFPKRKSISIKMKNNGGDGSVGYNNNPGGNGSVEYNSNGDKNNSNDDYDGSKGNKPKVDHLYLNESSVAYDFKYCFNGCCCMYLCCFVTSFTVCFVLWLLGFEVLFRNIANMNI
jgi:hypothetical protein